MAAVVGQQPVKAAQHVFAAADLAGNPYRGWRCGRTGLFGGRPIGVFLDRVLRALRGVLAQHLQRQAQGLLEGREVYTAGRAYLFADLFLDAFGRRAGCVQGAANRIQVLGVAVLQGAGQVVGAQALAGKVLQAGGVQRGSQACLLYTSPSPRDS